MGIFNMSKWFPSNESKYRVICKTYGNGKKKYIVQEYSCGSRMHYEYTYNKDFGFYPYEVNSAFHSQEEACAKLKKLQEIENASKVISEVEVKCEDCSNL